MPIMSSAIAKTINITENGTYDVTDCTGAVVNMPVAPDYYIEKAKDANGKLISTSNIIDLKDITDLSANVLAYAYEENQLISGLIDLHSLTAVNGKNAGYCTFWKCPNITGVNLHNLATVTGMYGCYNMFKECSGLTSIDLSSLTTVSGNYSMQSMFNGCPLSEVTLDNLTTVSGYSAFEGIFSNNSVLTKISFPKLTTISNTTAFGSVCGSCPSLTDIEFPLLTTISGSTAFSNAFAALKMNSQLATLKFPSLKFLTGSSALNYMCNRNNTNGYTSALSNIYFYALDTNSFGSYTNQFNNMIYKANGVTVHFPKRIQSTIGSWADVTAGFGGTNTVVSFDIVTSIVGNNGITYTRQEKDSITGATAWIYNNVIYYTNGNTEPHVEDIIYSDSTCTTTVTTISSIV